MADALFMFLFGVLGVFGVIGAFREYSVFAREKTYRKAESAWRCHKALGYVHWYSEAIRYGVGDVYVDLMFSTSFDELRRASTSHSRSRALMHPASRGDFSWLMQFSL